MKYYLFQSVVGDEKVAGKSVYEYDSEDAVVASYHSELGKAMKSALYHDILIMAIDENGKVIERKRHTKNLSA